MTQTIRCHLDGNIFASVISVYFQTVKTEPLDYPGEMVWTEGHGTINSDALDDAQGLLPLAAIPGTLEGVAAAIVASPNLPIMEFGECGSHCHLYHNVSSSL